MLCVISHPDANLLGITVELQNASRTTTWQLHEAVDRLNVSQRVSRRGLVHSEQDNNGLTWAHRGWNIYFRRTSTISNAGRQVLFRKWAKRVHEDCAMGHRAKWDLSCRTLAWLLVGLSFCLSEDVTYTMTLGEFHFNVVANFSTGTNADTVDVNTAASHLGGGIGKYYLTWTRSIFWTTAYAWHVWPKELVFLRNKDSENDKSFFWIFTNQTNEPSGKANKNESKLILFVRQNSTLHLLFFQWLISMSSRFLGFGSG